MKTRYRLHWASGQGPKPSLKWVIYDWAKPSCPVVYVERRVTGRTICALLNAESTTVNKRGRSQRPTAGTPTPRASKSSSASSSPKKRRKNPHAVALGRLGGRAGQGITSVLKAASARRNGLKGGRPKEMKRGREAKGLVVGLDGEIYRTD